MPRKRANFPRPKIRVYPNGKATLSGIMANDLDSILTAASLYRYDHSEPRKPELDGGWLDEIKVRNYKDELAWFAKQRWLVDQLQENLKGEKNEARRLLSKLERWQRIRQNQELDKLLEELITRKGANHSDPN